MKLPLQISFKNLERSEALIQAVKEKAAKLDRLCPDIIFCRVVITWNNKNHRSGNFFSVNIEVSVPGKEIAVSRESQDDRDNQDVYHVLKDAFLAAYRQVEDYNTKRKSNAA